MHESSDNFGEFEMPIGGCPDGSAIGGTGPADAYDAVDPAFLPVEGRLPIDSDGASVLSESSDDAPFYERVYGVYTKRLDGEIRALSQDTEGGLDPSGRIGGRVVDVMLGRVHVAAKAGDVDTVKACAQELRTTFPNSSPRIEASIAFAGLITGDESAIESLRNTLQNERITRLNEMLEWRDALPDEGVDNLTVAADKPALDAALDACREHGVLPLSWIDECAITPHENARLKIDFLEQWAADIGIDGANRAAMLDDCVRQDFSAGRPVHELPDLLQLTADPELAGAIIDAFVGGLDGQPFAVWKRLGDVATYTYAHPEAASFRRYALMHEALKAMPRRDAHWLDMLAATARVTVGGHMFSDITPEGLLGIIDRGIATVYDNADDRPQLLRDDQRGVGGLRDDILASTADGYMARGNASAAGLIVSSMQIGGQQTGVYQHCFDRAQTLGQIRALRPDEAVAMLDPLLDARYHIAEARLARDTEALAHYATEAAQYIQDNLADPAIAVVAEAWRRSFAIDRIAGTALAGILIGTVRDAVGYAHELAVELSETLIAAGDSEELRRADEAIRAEHDPAARVALLWRLAKGILP